MWYFKNSEIGVNLLIEFWYLFNVFWEIFILKNVLFLEVFVLVIKDGILFVFC